jgi:hypothetical protein
MAKKLTSVPTNLTEYPNSFKRQGAFPLEAYEIFYDISEAEAYAQSDLAYVGQTLKVVSGSSVMSYVIKNEAGELHSEVQSEEDNRKANDKNITGLSDHETPEDYENSNEKLRGYINQKAPINNPTFTGVPKSTTASNTTKDTQIATTEFVHNVLDDIIIFEVNGCGVPTSNYENWNGEYEGYTFEEN